MNYIKFGWYEPSILVGGVPKMKIAEVHDWPTVPRLGERLHIEANSNAIYVVTDVLWGVDGGAFVLLVQDPSAPEK